MVVVDTLEGVVVNLERMAKNLRFIPGLTPELLS
jgi:hypothetical protein